jgi:hypothetical protein
MSGSPTTNQEPIVCTLVCLCFSSRAWLCWVETKKLRVCMGATGSIGGAYIISSPRVPGHAHFTLNLSPGPSDGHVTSSMVFMLSPTLFAISRQAAIKTFSPDCSHPWPMAVGTGSQVSPAFMPCIHHAHCDAPLTVSSHSK